MKKPFLCICVVLCAHFAYSQSEPIVAVDNITVIHEHKGWRVISASTTPIHFNLMKGDLIVRIDGKNAGDTGPMQIANLFNEGYRRKINVFIERGGFGMEIGLREIPMQDYEPIGANPFKRVATGFSAPDADLKGIDNLPINLKQFKGEWVLINFMATWCAPCIVDLPKVLSIAAHDQLSLLTVALNDKTEAVRRMQQNYKMVSPIAMEKTMTELPIDFGITTSRWTGQIPALVLIRPDGDVALIDIGGIDADHVGKTIENLMHSKADQDLK